IICLVGFRRKRPQHLLSPQYVANQKFFRLLPSYSTEIVNSCPNEDIETATLIILGNLIASDI
ncbi:hypothetical protein, partial [Sphingobacterium multivorum]|uniref:hypothetical protein n=1 Tax=Sphingobacterium multivorum TaxID=28454 RepID=UPI0028964412